MRRLSVLDRPRSASGEMGHADDVLVPTSAATPNLASVGGRYGRARHARLHGRGCQLAQSCAAGRWLDRALGWQLARVGTGLRQPVTWPDPPLDAATTEAELDQLHVFADQRDTAALDQIAFWDTGGP
jgi:hypothetical protein